MDHVQASCQCYIIIQISQASFRPAPITNSRFCNLCDRPESFRGLVLRHQMTDTLSRFPAMIRPQL